MKEQRLFGISISTLLLIILVATFLAQGSHLATDGKLSLPIIPGVVDSFPRPSILSLDLITGQQTQTQTQTQNAPHALLSNLSFGPKIEAYASYVGQSQCDPIAKPGVLAFRTLLLTTFPGTGDDGITRPCGIGGQSEHKEGRAWDWAVSAANVNDVAKVHQLFASLFAPDKYGNKDALIRRLGIMYLIWDYHIWSASLSSDGWQPYNGPNPHTDHVHFSFSWDGANKKTSFWSPSLSY